MCGEGRALVPERRMMIRAASPLTLKSAQRSGMECCGQRLVGIQAVSACIGRVTGLGVAANIRNH